MRKVFLICIFGVLGFVFPALAQDISAQSPQEQFKAANQMYKNGRYQEAISIYQSVLDAGFESGEVYFNLGNAWYRQNKLGLARLNYERAARFLKNDDGLQENLALVTRSIVDKIEQPPQFFLFVWWQSLLDVFSMHLLSWLVAGSLGLLLISAAWRRHRLRRGRAFRGQWVFVTSMVLFVILTFLFVQKIYRQETRQFAVILNPSVTLLAEPNENGTEVFVLHEGSKVQLLRENSDWLEIRLADGKTGWLKSSNLEII